MFLLKCLVALALIMTLRCPVVAQQLSAQMQALSSDCTEGNGLIRSFQRERVVHERGRTSLSLGVQYDRASAPAKGGNFLLQKQVRAGVPILAGYRLGPCLLQAGGFLGIGMQKGQESFWFKAPDQVGRTIDSARGLMLRMGLNIGNVGELNLGYVKIDDVPDTSTLSRLNVGWKWQW